MERWTVAGIALLSSAVLMFGLSLAMEGIVATVLQAVAAVDGLLGLFLFMKGMRSASETSVRMPAEPAHVVLERLRPDLVRQLGTPAEDVITLVQQKRAIEAIKLVRERTGYGLKEAKDLVDAVDAATRRKS